MAWEQMKEFARFSDAVNAQMERMVGLDVVTWQKKVAFDILKKIMEKTPVDTGRARGSWRLTIQAASEEMIKKHRKSTGTTRMVDFGGAPDDQDVWKDALSATNQLQPFETIFITNNVPYILKLEDGSSKQAARGMVAVTLSEVADAYEL